MLAWVRDGRIVRVSGDPDHPVTRGAICGKAVRYAERMYSPDRVLYPQRRVGPKGEGRFERISWDEALDLIAERLHAVVDAYGAEAILPYSYAGTMGITSFGSMDRRLFNRLGASQLARTVCSAAGNAGYDYTVGGKRGTDPETTSQARYIIAWGSNLASVNMHQLTYVRQAQRAGATFVHIDVQRNRTTAFADRFVQLRPGTDAALALGMMHVIIRDGLHDAAYVQAHTVGFEALAERVRAYPPERAARICDVPAEVVETLAREYATTRPAFIRIGNGLQHHDNGGMAVRTIACLPGLVGAWRDVGGGAVKSNGGYAAMNDAALMRPDLLAGRVPRTINMNQLGHALTALDDPPVKAMVVYNTNPAVIAPDQRRVLAGLKREDLFTVVHEQLMTDTARYADVVLPATTHFEQTDLYSSYWHLYLAIAEPAVAPLGEAKSNVEFFSLLAKRLGFEDECFEDDVETLIAQALDNPANPFLKGITLGRLKEGGPVRLNVEAPHPAFADGQFPTPSGRIELYSERMARDGLDPLPTHIPLNEGGDGEQPPSGPYPLLFITPPNHFFLNSTYANMPSNVRSEERPRLEIHPEDARTRGILDGDAVQVFNARGDVQLEASLTEDVRPGVVVSRGLWWGRHSPGGHGVNATTPQRLADMGGGATFFSNLVEVSRLEAHPVGRGQVAGGSSP
jgi:anaerobic selenocysteine-containing dehydrogenase